MPPSAFVAIILGAVLIYGLWSVTKTKWTVRIVVDRSGIRSHRGLAKARMSEIVEFFDRDVSLDARVVVSAMRNRSGLWRIKIAGPIDAGTRQRIRNFFIAVL